MRKLVSYSFKLLTFDSNFKFRVLLKIGIQFYTQFKSKSNLYTQKMPLSKEKNLRRIVIDKLYNKNDHPMKQSTRSNAPTESTPNQPKDQMKAISNFFENFQSQCAIIYEPVKLKDHKPLKRSLQAEMNCLYQNDIKVKLRDDEPSIFSSSMKLPKNPYKSTINIHKNQSRTRLASQRQDNLAKVKDGRSTSKENKFQNLKTQSILLKMRSPILNKNPSKQKSLFEDNNSSLRQSYKSLRIEHLKMQIQKPIINLQKQIDQYITNSKNSYQRLMQKNAPKKHQKVDRIKRIQSLKNLNENGVRKYSYKRQP